MENTAVNYDREKRRAKGMTNMQFWDWMAVLHTRAYESAQKHYKEAMDIVLTSK